MTNDDIIQSGFLPEFLVLGMLKSADFQSVSDDLISWGSLLSKCEVYEDFCKLNSMSLTILTDAHIDPPINKNIEEDKVLCSLLESCRTSSLFEKLVGLIKTHGEKFQNQVAIPEMESALKEIFGKMGLKCEVISPSDKKFESIEKALSSDKKLSVGNKAIFDMGMKDLVHSTTGLDIVACRNNVNFIKIGNFYFEKNFISRLSYVGSSLTVSSADKDFSFESKNPEKDILKITNLLKEE